MSMVTLVSGGLDSTLMACIAQESGIEQFPLFVDYGQLSRDKELAACRKSLEAIGLGNPQVMDISGFGKTIQSGLTSQNKDIYKDAFTPGRNMLFLLAGAAWGYQKDATTISIGLLHPDTCLFPDQTEEFLKSAEDILSLTMGRNFEIIAPLSSFYKQDVVALAKLKGIIGTYSCHAGGETPCGKCIACKEYEF